jgi:hypothetical protein
MAKVIVTWQNIIMKRILIFCAVFLSFSALSSAQATVQTALGIDPAILEAVLNTNAPTIKQITVTNNSNLPQPIKTLKQGFALNEVTGLSADELKIYDSSSWISITDNDTDFILQPHESRRITVTINQPAIASPGGHYASIIFQPMIPEELVSQGSVFVYARVAVLVFLQVKGNIVENLELVNSDYSAVSSPGSHAFDFTIKNTGNTHIQPSGKLNIYDATDQLIATEQVPAEIILPKAEKQFHFNVDLPNIFGKYSAELILTYGSQSTILNSGKNDFYIFPFTLVFLVIIPTGILVFFFVKYRSRFILAYHVLKGNNSTAESLKDHFPSESIRSKLRYKVKH